MEGLFAPERDVNLEDALSEMLDEDGLEVEDGDEDGDEDADPSPGAAGRSTEIVMLCDACKRSSKDLLAAAAAPPFSISCVSFLLHSPSNSLSLRSSVSSHFVVLCIHGLRHHCVQVCSLLPLSL